MITLLLALTLSGTPANLGSCDAGGKCVPGYVETCRVHAGQGKAKRTDRMKRDYKARFPCPTTGKLQKSCPGWEIDHLIPLCCGGADVWTNARWLEADLHRLRHKDGVDCTGFPRSSPPTN